MDLAIAFLADGPSSNLAKSNKLSSFPSRVQGGGKKKKKPVISS